MKKQFKLLKNSIMNEDTITNLVLMIIIAAAMLFVYTMVSQAFGGSGALLSN